MNYIIRSDLTQKLSGNEDNDLLTDYLKNNYGYIYDSMKNEGYNIRFDEFMLFSEIIFEDKVVGFGSYKIYESQNATLLEIYVLPQFRGNHLFFEEIMRMSLFHNSLSIREPTRFIVEMMIHYRIAEKLNDNLVATGFSFDISNEHLLKHGRPAVEGDICSCFLYDLDLCSPLYLGDISTPGSCDVAYQKCLKQDREEYGCEEFRNSIDISEYFSHFKKVFLKNHKRFEKSLTDVNERLSWFDETVYQSCDYTSDFLLRLAEEGIITSEEASNLDKQIQRELDEGIITGKSMPTRVSYLIEGNDLSKDRELLLKNLSEPQYLCPYCYQPIELQDSFCNTCGHVLSKNEYLMPDEIMDEIQKDDAVVLDLRGDKLNKFIEEFSSDEHDSSSDEFYFDSDDEYLKLLEIYRNHDDMAFREFKEGHDLPLDNIEEIAQINYTFPMEFPDLGITYFKNFYTSTLLTDMDKPINKHTLDGSVEFRIGDIPDSNTYQVHKVLAGLKENPNIFEVIENQKLDKNRNTVLYLFNKEFIESKEYGERIYGVLLNKFTVKELKDILRKHGLKLSGKKDDLVVRLLEKDLFYEFGITDFVLTPKGETVLGKTSWVDTFMTTMDYFDFDDFYKFINENNSGGLNFEDIALKYLNLQLKTAYENKDFHRLHDVYASRALCHVRWGDIKKALKDELTLYIIRLNPIFLNDDDLKSFNPIEFSNIQNIIELGDYLNIYRFKKLFAKSWSEVKLEKRPVPKKMALNYLNKAINGYDLDELSDEIKNRYY